MRCLPPSMAAMTDETFKAMTAAIAQSVVQAITTLNMKTNKIDQKAIGGPPTWDSSKEDGFLEWKLKLEAWLVNQEERAMKWLKAARDLDEKFETDDLDLKYASSDQTELNDIKRFNAMLYNIMVTKLSGEAFKIVTSVRDGCGIEAWRLITKRYEPRTPATKRALLKTIFNMKAAKKVEEIEKNVLKLEEIYNRYEAMAKGGLPEDIKTVIMIELCTPDLKEHLEFNLKDVDYKDTREAVMAYVERKRRDPLTAMEVGNHEHDSWWGGTGGCDYYENEELYEHEVNYNGYSWKGKGPSFGTKGKGKDAYKGGGKDYGKGGGKDFGKNKGKDFTKGKGKDFGKGKNEFQGHCHWCGKWGHSASRCSDKDMYMDWVRSGKGSGNNYQQNNGKGTNNVESQYVQQDEWKTPVEALSSLNSGARQVDVCNLNANYNKNFPKLHNRFAVLEDESLDEDTPSRDEDVEGWRQPPLLSGPSPTPNEHPMKVSLRPRKGVWGSARPRPSSTRVEHPLGSCERKVEMNYINDDQYLDFTVDSGAGENVMSEHMAPQVPVQYSTEQDAGVVYVAANGSTMGNHGKKVLHVCTREGQFKRMNMQVTDVNKALMSVAKICDAGHTVVFRRDGGLIRNDTSGEETKFRRENNVYRLKVKLSDSGFTRQG